MVKARVSGVPYEVDLPEKKESIDFILGELAGVYSKLVQTITRMEANHAEEIATLEHEIKLVRARNDRLEREASNPLQK